MVRLKVPTAYRLELALMTCPMQFELPHRCLPHVRCVRSYPSNSKPGIANAHSRSAIAANTIMRSLFGAIFPLFATYMFDGLGINYGMTLLGCVAALFIPMPFLFYYKGKTIRAKSKFAPAPDIEQDKRRDEESRGSGSDGSNGQEKKQE